MAMAEDDAIKTSVVNRQYGKVTELSYFITNSFCSDRENIIW
jgi:hypothetical protein